MASPDDSVASLDSANFALLSRYSSNTPDVKVPLNVEFNKENATNDSTTDPNAAMKETPAAVAKTSTSSSHMSAIEKANALLARTKNKRGGAKKTVEFASEIQTKPPTPVKPARPSSVAKTSTPAKKVLKTKSTPTPKKKALKTRQQVRRIAEFSGGEARGDCASRAAAAPATLIPPPLRLASLVAATSPR